LAEPALTVTALSGIPRVQPGDDLPALLIAAIERGGLVPRPGDILVVAQKIVSKAEGRHLELASVAPGARASELATVTGKDARLVEAILSESAEVLRARPRVLIAVTRHGFVMANAGVDQSNLEPGDDGRRVLLLPEAPDLSALRIKDRLDAHFGGDIGVIVSDSTGRAWRLGTVGVAIGAAGVPSLMDRRGEPDLAGRPLEATEVGFADAVAAAAVLVMGEAAEAHPAVLVRGLQWTQDPSPATALVRPMAQDLFR
jgi:coenzyme F420-0:L-glutamate ligase / coenzyme F420-1:gamma-L-glutamate ligase